MFKLHNSQQLYSKNVCTGRLCLSMLPSLLQSSYARTHACASVHGGSTCARSWEQVCTGVLNNLRFKPVPCTCLYLRHVWTCMHVQTSCNVETHAMTKNRKGAGSPSMQLPIIARLCFFSTAFASLNARTCMPRTRACFSLHHAVCSLMRVACACVELPCSIL